MLSSYFGLSLLHFMVEMCVTRQRRDDGAMADGAMARVLARVLQLLLREARAWGICLWFRRSKE
jgi:hypothetical protein